MNTKDLLAQTEYWIDKLGQDSTVVDGGILGIMARNHDLITSSMTNTFETKVSIHHNGQLISTYANHLENAARRLALRGALLKRREELKKLLGLKTLTLTLRRMTDQEIQGAFNALANAGLVLDSYTTANE